MDEHVTQGRTITLVPHTPLETPRRPFSDQRNSGTRHFTVNQQPTSTPTDTESINGSLQTKSCTRPSTDRRYRSIRCRLVVL